MIYGAILQHMTNVVISVSFAPCQTSCTSASLFSVYTKILFPRCFVRYVNFDRLCLLAVAIVHLTKHRIRKRVVCRVDSDFYVEFLVGGEKNFRVNWTFIPGLTGILSSLFIPFLLRSKIWNFCPDTS